jgi:hypothetical protein
MPLLAGCANLRPIEVKAFPIGHMGFVVSLFTIKGIKTQRNISVRCDVYAQNNLFAIGAVIIGHFQRAINIR